MFLKELSPTELALLILSRYRRHIHGIQLFGIGNDPDRDPFVWLGPTRIIRVRTPYRDVYHSLAGHLNITMQKVEWQLQTRLDRENDDISW